MRVLHIDRGTELRGGQWQVLRLLEGLAGRGIDVQLMTDPDGPVWPKASGILRIPIGIVALRRAARQSAVIHAHDARSHTLAVLAVPDRPLVVSRRVAFPVHTGLLSRWKYKRADHYLAISEAVAGELREAGIEAGRISVVPDGVELPASVIPYEDRPWSPGSVIAPASNDAAKASDLVSESARVARVPVQFSTQLADDLRRARIFVYLSRSEGLGSAALLAMAQGVPVIASRVGGLVEVVENEVTGLLTGNDPHDVGAAIRRLMGSPELASRMSAAARLRVAERFSVTAMVEGTLAVYRRVVEERGT